MTATDQTATLASIAETLHQAQAGATAVAQITATTPLTLADAYAVQHLLVQRRTTGGERLTGVKLGFTSRAKAQQMGVNDVIIGSLTTGMAAADGDELDHAAYIHPRIEPEVAFLLGQDIDVQDDAPDLLGAVTGVAPALEVIDSRYRDFKFTLADVVADNTSAAGYVLGPWSDPGRAGDIANRGVRLEVDGAVVSTGSTAAILGHPLRALAAARRMARLHGFELRAGTVLLAGAATEAVPLPSGSVIEATVAGLGRVAARASSRASND